MAKHGFIPIIQVGPATYSQTGEGTHLEPLLSKHTQPVFTHRLRESGPCDLQLHRRKVPPRACARKKHTAGILTSAAAKEGGRNQTSANPQRPETNHRPGRHHTSAFCCEHRREGYWRSGPTGNRQGPATVITKQAGAGCPADAIPGATTGSACAKPASPPTGPAPSS